MDSIKRASIPLPLPILSNSSTKTPFAIADSYTEKAIVGTLMAIDALSYISPFRWLPHLAGCGDEQPTYPKSSGADGGTRDVPSKDASARTTLPPNQTDAGTPPPPICKEGEAMRLYDGDPSTLNVGSCKEGLAVCVDGSWQIEEEPIYPQTEIPCNNEDEDCDGTALQGTDQDGDGYKIEGGLCGPQDCDDTNLSVHPDAPAGACIGMDYNCDGNINLVTTMEPTVVMDMLPYDNASSLFTEVLPPPVWNGFEFGAADYRFYDFEWAGNGNGMADIHFRKINSMGHLVSSILIASEETSPWPQSPSIIWTGRNYGIVWRVTPRGDGPANPQGLRGGLYFNQLTSDGIKLHQDKKISDNDIFPGETYAADGNDLPKIAWTGNEFGVVSTCCNRNAIAFRRLDPNGNKIGNDRVIWEGQGRLSTFPSVSDIIWIGAEYGFTWIASNEETGSYFTRLSPDGSQIGDLISLTQNQSLNPYYFGWDDTHYTIIQPQRYADRNPILTKIYPSEGRLETTPIDVPDYPINFVSTSYEYIAAWVESNAPNLDSIYFQRMSESGLLLGNRLVIQDLPTVPQLIKMEAEVGCFYESVAQRGASENELKFVKIGCQ